MTTLPNDKLPGLDELSQQLAAEIERDMPVVDELLKGVMAELQQLIDELPPITDDLP